MRTRRHSAFTLVELMVVVVIVGIVGALSARLYSKGSRGQKAASFARSLMATLLEARQSAITLGRPTRVTMTPGSVTTKITVAYYDSTTATATWTDQSKVEMPSGLQLCSASQYIKTTTPTCPATASQVLCFYPNGRADLPSSGACSTSSPISSTGATIWFDTKTADKKFRIWVWGLTGLVKMVDQW